ncbi:5'-methylthioadenosine/adenosylhomocysteine nucleosidase [Secundilactobacillus similis DSM 23365 = JCM 2765]|jgi:adenosylhomocysteine nucleosidase|uniref:adenosylhomocysteine nucleosidase n=1 Tax=Secundilactobacillus similis DSM 23365 = JCM 2765 TaxID=1423804 RepID=A0A0R2FCR1_9LACO|nr:5'-methylthioadenosine/adenosylhomocysteine nucleosidase [Secundilactobacillus similis]KRN26319.1 nucleoside phosphorylase [Secundilactobacillus similis DSM 23365 = JCM 2765]
MKYGILCAMDEEIATLKAALTDEHVVNVSGIDFYEGTISGQDVVLVRSGIGKVEAGLTTALLITQFKVSVVINSGSAGGIGEGLHVGDVVLSTQTAYHDVDAQAFDYAYGQLPGQPARFDANQSWIDRLEKAAKKTGLTVRKGLIVTGDQFIASREAIDNILAHFPDALSSEMEGAAVGQVAHQFETPYVVVRAMSDVGDENAGVSFDQFIIEAGKRSAQMLLALFAE